MVDMKAYSYGMRRFTRGCTKNRGPLKTNFLSFLSLLFLYLIFVSGDGSLALNWFYVNDSNGLTWLPDSRVVVIKKIADLVFFRP